MHAINEISSESYQTRHKRNEIVVFLMHGLLIFLKINIVPKYIEFAGNKNGATTDESERPQ
jgi:hypothetical protein